MASPSGGAVKKSGLPRLSSGLNTPIRGSRESLTGTVDDWIIGDRCWISGTKLGKVAFLGETRFAQGEWAGVALDEPTGKNDGSVGGVRYFQCPPNCGIFCRVNKLSRKPEHNVVADQAASVLTEAAHADLQQRQSLASNEDMGQSITVSNADDDSVDLKDGDLKVGDRVLVSGTKNGVLRFIGATEFAQGVWGGVELDQPIGKNDGSVQGKRYFVCKPRYGLFAPMAKIEPAALPKSLSASKKLPSVRQTVTSNLRLNKNLSRAGSQESLSSLSSAQSSASRRVRLGVAALTVSSSNALLQKAASIRGGSIGPNASSVVSPTVNAYQESLKEKEQHVDQLMRERDIERSEMARLANQLEETRQELSELRDECKRSLTESQLQKEHLHTSLETSETECRRLTELLDEEKRRNEDLQFRIEEESITKTDLEGKISELLNQVGDKSQQTAEKNQAADLGVQNLQSKIDSLNAKIVNMDQIIAENRRTETSLRESLLKKETEMETKLRDKEDLIKNAETEIFNLREDAEHLHTDCENERKQNAHLKSINEKLEKDMTDWKSEMENLRSTNSQLTVEKENIEKSLSNLKEEKAKELEPIAASLQNKTKELETLKGEFDLVQIQLSELQRKANDSVEKLDAESADKDKKVSKLEVANKNLKMQLENQRIELEKMSMLATNSKLSSDSVQQTILDLRIEKDSLLDKVAVLEKDALTNRENFKKLESELLDARDQLKSQAGNNESLSKEISEMKSNLEKIEANRADLEKANVKLNEELLSAKNSNEQTSKALTDRFSEEKSQFELNISTLKDELSKRDVEIEKLAKEKIKSEEQLLTLDAQQSELVTLKTAQQTLQENNSKLDEEINIFKSRIGDLEKNCTQLETEKSHLTKDLASFKSLSEQNLEESTKQLVSEKEKINAELLQFKSESDQLRAEFEKISKEKQSLEEKLVAYSIQENEMKLLNEKFQTVTNNESRLSSELADAKQNAVLLEETCSSLKKELDELEQLSAYRLEYQTALGEEKKCLFEQKYELQQQIELFKQEIGALKNDLETSSRDKQTVETNLQTVSNELQQQVELLKQETGALKNDLETASRDKATLEAKLKTVSDEIASSSKAWMEEKTALRTEMQKQMELLATSKNEIEQRLSSASSQSIEFEKEKQKLSEEFQNVKQKMEHLNNVEEANKKLLADCQALREQEDLLKKGFEEETNSLKEKLHQLTVTLAQKDSELEIVQKSKLQATEMMTLTNDEITLLKNENLKLMTKLKDMEIMKSAATSTTKVDTQIAASSNDLEREVAFCNSVIADLVQKNQELQLKLDIFMNGGVDMVGNSAALPRIPKPRLFCDICEIFDAHDTEDCPKQAGEDESETHSHFNGVRNEVRSYCDNCEVFGHSTENCDQETF